MNFDYIDRNLETVRKKIAEAARAVGRDPYGITLEAAIKYATPDEIAHLARSGVKLFGENRVNQYREHKSTGCLDGADVHFIGTLQTNKVKYIVGNVTAVESLDSYNLAAELERLSAKAGVITDVYCEINSGREENKSGVLPENAEELCEKIYDMPHLRLVGFMTMAPNCAEKSEYRKYFAQTYKQALDIFAKKPHNIEEEKNKLPILSMGMSGSFEEAVLEGADIVRVGRMLFEK